MNIKTFLRVFVIHFFIIYGITMLMTLLWCTAFDSADTISVERLGWGILFALAADAPLCVFISREELTPKGWLVRATIHLAFLEIVLLPIGYALGMWGGVGGGFLFFFTVLAVDITMYALQYLSSKISSDAVNKRLAQIKEERSAIVVGTDENVACGEDDQNISGEGDA